MLNTFGTRFSVTTFGESHGPAIGAIIDGCPAMLPLSAEDIQPQLDRRRPGQSNLSTPRKESDTVHILSGLSADGRTLGTPISLQIPNSNQNPGDYRFTQQAPRPSHADFTYRARYGIAAASGGGRASARETAARVAAGAVAEKFLSHQFGTEIIAWVSSVGPIDAPFPDYDTISRDRIDASPVRCPHPETATSMEQLILDTMQSGDSIGGIITCICRHVPAGWGEPVFGKISALLAQAMLSIPACKGFEIGSGFAGARMKGSEHNDAFVQKGDRLGTITNRSGGIQGGITNGEPILFRAAFKPVATISSPQQSADYEGHTVTIAGKGRHDPCVLPRAVPIVESMAALTLADAALLYYTL